MDDSKLLDKTLLVEQIKRLDNKVKLYETMLLEKDEVWMSLFHYFNDKCPDLMMKYLNERGRR